ncbi:3-hydroxyacyl-CoA dehydrogenase [Stutzerimonas azotifigens]|uniref:3-hydroxyacyl-CoA dehydrogenase n=1 Tax=Stutzerimonas azotifigens TaxID=291995 RepID=UPI0004295CE3|nr:3-hydroxyacyl-CoA dehydrogenase [Stutzerimonas azotifigens]
MFSRIGIIGAGAMGRGIAQLFATAGQQVWLYDTRGEAVAEALKFNRDLLQRSVAKGRLTPAALEQTVARMQPAAELKELADCDLLIEAVVERLEVKQALFVELEGLVGEDTVLATNTSSLSVTQIASACRRPERVAGFHFFNPVPLMKLVEVVRGERTDPSVIERLVTLAEHAGHFPATTPDTPGFLVNHAGRAYGTEAQRIVSEGIATPEQVDRILRDGPGFKMGPFELFDLTGLDISHAVMESVHDQFYYDPRYTPSYLAAQRVAAGLLGRKSGQGYYRYENGQQLRSLEPAVPQGTIERPFWLGNIDPQLRARLRAVLDRCGAVLEEGDEPSDRAICIITPFGEDASQAIERLALPADRTLAYDLFSDFDKRRVLMRQPALEPALEAQACQAFAADGVPVEVINDSPGFVSQRVVASIVNLGCEILQKGIAAPTTLDRAIELALGYPKGPLAFAQHYGPLNILDILQGMQACYGGEPRYRPSPWLRRRVQLAVPLDTPDAGRH